MANIKILIATHKEFKLPQNNIFLPIQVGRKLANSKLNIQGDDEGDNISEKNNTYCELTALYWAWKNLTNIDYIGLSHYRRYFDFYTGGKYFNHLKIIKPDELTQYNFQVPNIEKLFNKYDIILAKPAVYEYRLKTEYCSSHVAEDYEVMKGIVKKFMPDYYDAFNQVFEENNKLSHFNMFIVSNKMFNDYCNWLFSLLGQIENNIDVSNYSARQKRIHGFMAERLLNVYVVKNNLRVKYFPVLCVDADIENVGFIMNMLLYLRAQSAFYITNFHLPKALKKLLK